MYDQPIVGCPLFFTEPRPAHNKIYDKIFSSNRSNQNNEDNKVNDDATEDDIVRKEESVATDHCLELLIAESRKPFVYDNNIEL